METLLSGGFICKTSDELAYQYLQKAEHYDAIERQLNTMNRTLSSANDGNVLFCAYQSIGDDERKQVNSQFKEVSSSLLPLVEWLVLVQEAQGDNTPISEGKVIRLNKLQTVIEDVPAFAEQLAKIARYSLFNSSSSAIDNQLKQIFKRLTELGYLLRPNPETQIYLATGKVDYLFDIIRFIDEAESLGLEQQAEMAVQQGDLL
ncbi:condensin complex protein MksE [Thalassotalea maritima]|uniref:condensin complex protein MksE n=1 Tax=Thalassotalea maritima TaxID=3242416 RepID=UPI003528B4FD